MSRATNFRRQKGQTIALVAISLVSFVAMGALAIDLTSLYSARSEIQRAANATALAAAKAFVDSGVATVPPTVPGNPNLTSRAQALTLAYATAAASQNLVANVAPQLVGSPTVDFSIPGDPRVTVKLQQTNIPLFFSRIWSRNFGTVSATAVAEAYNSAFSQSNGQTFLPSAPKCVKPILVPNLVPPRFGGGTFVDPTSGQVTPGKQFVGLGPFDLNTACMKRSNGCQVNVPPGPQQYLPMQVSNAHQYCPACAGGSDYEQSVECCDGTVFNAPQCGVSGAVSAQWDNTVNAGANGARNPVDSGLKCLIHETGSTTQDSLDPSSFGPGTGALISPGSFSQARYGLASTDDILTSDSIITVPIFDQTKFSLGNPQVKIVGFLTLFVNSTSGLQNGTFGVKILNVTGCGNQASTSAPVSGGGVSSIPVRLIHN